MTVSSFEPGVSVKSPASKLEPSAWGTRAWKPHQALALLPKVFPSGLTRGWRSWIVTFSKSPGSAPSTKIGPVSTCTPSPPPVAPRKASRFVCVSQAKTDSMPGSSLIILSQSSQAWCVAISTTTSAPSATVNTGASFLEK